MSRFMQTAAVVGSLAATAYAHGRVTSINAGGKDYDGFLNEYLYGEGPPADLIAWSADNGDNGFVDGSYYNSAADMACHKSGAPGGGAAKVAAGSTVTVTWGPDVWPESHHGPVLDYIAHCAGDDCSSASAGDLSFVKIGEAGLNDGSSAPGNWASDDIIAGNGKWEITIPESLAAGQYVVRHEIIALHSAGDTNGAQNYPQCFNIEVTGGGSAVPEGVTADKLYTPTDAGIKTSIYTAPIDYTIPGPAMWDGASGSGGSTGGGSSAPASSAAAPSYPATSAAAPSVPAGTAPAGTAPAGTASATGGSGAYPTEGAPYPMTSSSAPAYTQPASPTSSDVPIGAVTEVATSSSAPAAPTPSSSYGGSDDSSDDSEEDDSSYDEDDTNNPGTPSYGSGSGSGSGSYTGKPLPEGVTLQDLLGWVNYYLKKGFNADGVHARDVIMRRR